MGCHFNDLIDCHKNHKITCSKVVADKQVDEINKIISLRIDNSVCFCAGELDSFVSMKSMPDLWILPYQVCWVEFTKTYNNQNLIFGQLLYEESDSISSICFVKSRVDWFMCGVWRITQKKDGSYTNESGLWGPEMMGLGYEFFAHVALAFISALNCTNVQRIENKPSEKLQKARVKRGKQPLFSYWTLHVDLDRDPSSSTSQGGTHAPPRLHLRRGHARQYAPGKYCWVRACAVGNGKLGMVHKDYAVNG